MNSGFTVAKDLRLTAGEIIALAGDFYGVVGTPISNGKTLDVHKKNFRAAYQKLCKANPKQVKEILDVLNEEDQVYHMAKELGYKPHIGLQWFSTQGLKKYTTITKNAWWLTPHLALFYSRCMDLMKEGFDHFGKEAELAFEAGFSVAMDTVQEAAKKKGTEEGSVLLTKSVCQLFFSCHFLTDLFAAGHMRTPFKALRQYVKEQAPKSNTIAGNFVAGLLVNAMHNEDNTKGFMVHSMQYPEGWKAYGDKCAFSERNVDNYEKAIEIVTVVLQQLYTEFRIEENEESEEEEAANTYTHYLPREMAVKNPSFFPLFRVTVDGVERRKNMESTACKEYIFDWSPLKTLTFLHFQKEKYSGAEKKEMQAFGKAYEKWKKNEDSKVVEKGYERLQSAEETDFEEYEKWKKSENSKAAKKGYEQLESAEETDFEGYTTWKKSKNDKAVKEGYERLQYVKETDFKESRCTIL